MVKQHWAYRMFSNKHTYVYISIAIGLILSHPNLPWASVTVALCLAICSSVSATAFMYERIVGLKKLLAFEQAKVIMKDKEIQEAVRKRKEAYFKLRKATQPSGEAAKDLPIARPAATVVRLPAHSSHLAQFVLPHNKSQKGAK